MNTDIDADTNIDTDMDTDTDTDNGESWLTGGETLGSRLKIRITPRIIT
jgi:hypothetical protein